MRTNARRLLAALATASLLTSLSALPVSADANCNAGELCLWGNANYGGDFWDPTFHDLNWPWPGIENDDNSVQNKDTRAHLIYPNSSGGGVMRYCVNSLENEDDIAADRDDDGDSNFEIETTTCPIGYQHP
jgi:hypothetical protein